MLSGLTITACNRSHFQAVKHYIHEFELDDRELKQEEFIVALHHGLLAGFGRIRDYAGCSELCSLGVTEPLRLKGLGSALVKALSETVQKPLFLVCVIPSFFEPLGFALCHEYPAELQQKLDYCTSQLPVNEPYVVMAKK